MACRRDRSRASGIFIGGFVALLGVGFLLDQLGVISVGRLWEWWPLALVVIGVGHILDRRWFSGIAFLVGGAWLLGWMQGFMPGLDAAWPILPIVAGVSLMRGAAVSHPASEDHLAAFWSGHSVRLRGKPPAAVTATAVMGGCELNLVDVELAEGEEMTIIATVLWGGIEIRMPEDWTLEDRVIPLLGAVEHTPNPLANGRKLVLRGTACMGGIEVKSAR